MDTKAAHSILWKIYRTVSDHHQQHNYLYALDDVISVDRDLADALAKQPPAFHDLCEILVGEAQIEMLYETADTHMLGMNISDATRNEIFMEHLENRIDTMLEDVVSKI